ncbi:MAG: SNF2-related protein, partial [Burkholderiales bacterium]
MSLPRLRFEPFGYQLQAARSVLRAMRGRAILADEVGLGKSYVALGVALARAERLTLVVPAVLVPQWRELLDRFGLEAPIVTHETLSTTGAWPSGRPAASLWVIDEAHRFRNPETRRYRALARLLVGRRALFVTATPIHNRPGDLFHLFRLFLRDHALAALGIPSLRHAALDRCEPQWAAAIVPRLVVARSRARVRVGYAPGALALHFPVLLEAKQIRAAPLSDETAVAEIVALIGQLGAGGPAAPLLRLMLLRRLGSSLAAFRATLSRHEMYVDLALRAAAEGRKLTRREFQRCFPQTPDGDAQLAMWPLLLAPGQTTPTVGDRELIQRIDALLRRTDATDPKAEALTTALDADPGKTIVFTDSRVTARYLLRRLSPRRVAALCGDAGRFAAGEARRGEIL